MEGVTKKYLLFIDRKDKVANPKVVQLQDSDSISKDLHTGEKKLEQPRATITDKMLIFRTMRNLKLLILTLLFPLATFAQSDTILWVETEGEIVNIEKIQRGRKSITRATVNYNTVNDTTVYQGKLDLIGLPFIGSFQSVGDDVKMLYAKNQPILIKSGESDLIDKYGLYILIFIGVLFSLWRMIGVMNKRKNVSQTN